MVAAMKVGLMFRPASRWAQRLLREGGRVVAMGLRCNFRM